MLTEEAEWRGNIDLWLDNEAVVLGIEQVLGAVGSNTGRHMMSDKQKGYGMEEKWLWERDSRDLWEVTIALIKSRPR